MKDAIEQIKNELSVDISGEIKIGAFKLQTAKKTLLDEANKPNPKQLYMSYWTEGEVCCLFSDSNLGKSIYAVQIGVEISKQQKVILFDCELSAKQFQMRYTDYQGNLYDFPDNFMRAEIDPEGLDVNNINDCIIGSIEELAIRTGTKVIIIDNISYMCIESEKAEAAGSLMSSLIGLKKKHGWSILILAHTPKRSLSNPITQNDLAGSKKLFNFFDSVFAIGKSAKDGSLRYIKQIKNRNFAFDDIEVRVCSIEKEGAFLHFADRGISTEKEHLKEVTEKEANDLETQILYCIKQGKSYRDTAAQLGVSKSKVETVVKKSKSNKTNELNFT